MPFEKGHKGRGNKRLVANTLRRLALQSPDKLRAACEKILEKAMEGDVKAFEILADRLDGKSPQTVNVTKRVRIGDSSTLAGRLEAASASRLEPIQKDTVQ